MDTTDARYYGGGYDAVIEKYYATHPLGSILGAQGMPFHGDGILRSMCSMACNEVGKFSCAGQDCIDINTCKSSTAVVSTTLSKALSDSLHVAEVRSFLVWPSSKPIPHHFLGLNRSAVVITLLGKQLTKAQHLAYFDMLVRLFAAKFTHVEWHATFVPVLHPGEWEDPAGNVKRPEAEVTHIDLIKGWQCSDDMYNELLFSSCEIILPLGCSASPPQNVIEQTVSPNTTVGDICKVSCGMCPEGEVVSTPPSRDVCADTSEVSLCMHLLRRYCGNIDVIPDVCSKVLYCPEVREVRALPCGIVCKPGEGRTCEEGIFAAQQTDDGYVFCVDVLTGEELADTRVPSERREELSCAVPKGKTKGGIWNVPSWMRVAHSRIMTRTATVAHFHAGKARSRALRGLLIKAVPEAEFTFTRDNRTGASVVTASPSVAKLLQQQRENPHSNFDVLGFAAAMEVERGVAGFLRASLDTPFTIESAMELALYEPERRLDTLREDTAVAEIPGKVVVTFRLAKKMRENVTHISVAFQNGFEQEQPKGGFYWGLYAQRMDGKCPIPDDAVFDPTGVGMQPDCLVGDPAARSWSCRLGDLTRKLGKLQHNATFVESKITLSGQGSVLGTVLVVRGHGWTHCALLTAPTEVGGTALVADFSHETTQTSGVELSGSVNIWQKGPWEDTLISASLRAGEELRNVSFHISSKRLEEYPEGCAAGYTPDTDLYDPFAVVLATLGRSVPRSSPSECLAMDGPSDSIWGTSFSDYVHYEYRCPLGDLTPHMRAAYIATKASNPANSNATPVVYNYTVSHTYLNVAGTPGALRPNSELFRGGHTLVLLREGKVLACAELQGKGPSDHSTAAAEARPTTPTADAGMSVLAMCLVVAGALFVAVLVGYVVGVRWYIPTPTRVDCEGKDVEDDM